MTIIVETENSVYRVGMSDKLGATFVAVKVEELRPSPHVALGEKRYFDQLSLGIGAPAWFDALRTSKVQSISFQNAGL